MIEEKHKADEELETIRAELFSIKREDYGVNYNQHLLEEYKMYVNMMDKTSERRASANTFFLTINSAIIGLMGLLLKISGGTILFNVLWNIMSAIFGILLCLRWEEIIQSYSDLNTGRFVIIHMLEERLPAKLYKSEWDYLNPKEEASRYTPMTITEKRVPQLLKLLYVILMVIVIVSYTQCSEFQQILNNFMSIR